MRRYVRTGGRLKWHLRGDILREKVRRYYVLVLKDMRKGEIWTRLLFDDSAQYEGIMR